MRFANTVIFGVAACLVLAGCAANGTPEAGALADSPATSSSDSAAPSAIESTTPEATPTPTPETTTVTETQKIPYKTRQVNDSSLARGTTKVRVRGVAGVRTLTYEVTMVNGEQTEKRLVRRVVTRPPVTRVIAVGTKAARQCDPNYSGCVPIASDVDCAGGSGNGPGYVQGPVRVTGSDIYDLDRDGDGVACD
jgi:hypothetical protein